MATILLSTAGAALGGALFGPIGAIAGRAAGGFGGNLIDQRLFSKDQVIRGPRLEDAMIMASSDGAPMPKLYGRARLGGQLIWATRHQEVTTQESQGGKGSPAVSVTNTAYYGNFAIAICEGPISHVSRIWADGKELDQTRHEIRVHIGAADQLPDPLIEAKQGIANAPAMRGTAYVVFEAFALADFGNRIPQFSFEAVRSVAKLDRDIRAVTIIPGATEFGLSPGAVEQQGETGTRLVNRNTSTHPSDWSASLDALQALCPNLETVALVVSWFGDDLRAGVCRIEPKVEYSAAGATWVVSGVTRLLARETSRLSQRPAYGGTPSDKSVLQAIADLKQRGLKVVLYPFVLMDIAAGNTLADPYGEPSQPAYPWRGRISCHPAIGQPDSADSTALAVIQISGFVGNAAPADFLAAGDTVQCSNSEFSLRRLVLHYAHLAVQAGGVDGFLIGSELVGLTTVRDNTGAYPFVEALAAIAADVRTIVGANTKLTYGADWSEYFGHQPQDGSGDLRYHLDPLWAHPAISVIGIDNYMPLADWRSGGDPGDMQARSQFDLKYLGANITAGEGFDWFYPSKQDRIAGQRTAITDGSGEPWVWRYKDIASWWSNPHHERIGGVTNPLPTSWIPKSKPVWFTELGCAAVTMGANQPNVFADAKSSQSALPHFSTGARCDLAQNRFLQAHLSHWSMPEKNPVSPLYGSPMVDHAGIFPWAWDARPFPQFPANTGTWADGSNWHTGHWLNGRIGACPLDDLVAAIGADFDLEITANCDGFLDGYVIPGPMPARGALEPLVEFFGLSADDENGSLHIISTAYAAVSVVDAGELVESDDAPRIRHQRLQESDLPQAAEISHSGIFNGYESGHSYSRRLETASRRLVSMQLPAVMPRSTAVGVLESRSREAWIGRDKLQIVLPRRYAHLSVGDRLQFNSQIVGHWRIEAIEDGAARKISLRSALAIDDLPSPDIGIPAISSQSIGYGRPAFHLLNLPLQSATGAAGVWAALDGDPWAGHYAIWAAPDLTGFRLRRTTAKRAISGRLLQPLAQGAAGRWDLASSLHVRLHRGHLSSKGDSLILNGGNAAAVRAQNGEWEILQFAKAELQNDGSWVLSRLLRAQHGTDPAMQAGMLANADFILLDEGIEAIELGNLEQGLVLNWRAGPASDPVAAATYAGLLHSHAALDKRTLSPAHAAARRLPSGDIDIGWIRRTRLGGDDWEAAEVPLGELQERYQLKILGPADAVVRSIETTGASHVYPASQQTADFGTLPASLAFTLAQIADSGLPGAARRTQVSL